MAEDEAKHIHSIETNTSKAITEEIKRGQLLATLIIISFFIGFTVLAYNGRYIGSGGLGIITCAIIFSSSLRKNCRPLIENYFLFKKILTFAPLNFFELLVK